MVNYIAANEIIHGSHEIYISGHITCTAWDWTPLHGTELTPIYWRFIIEQCLDVLEDIKLPTVSVYALPEKERMIFI